MQLLREHETIGKLSHSCTHTRANTASRATRQVTEFVAPATNLEVRKANLVFADKYANGRS